MGKKSPWLFLTTIIIGTGICILSYKKYMEYKKQEILNHKLKQAEEFLKSKHFTAALNLYLELLEEINDSNKDKIQILEQISEIYVIKKDYKKALNTNEKILKKDINNLLALKRAFKCHKKLENNQTCLEFLYKIVKFDTDFMQKEKQFLTKIPKIKAQEKMNQKFIPKPIYWNEMVLMFPNLKKRFEMIDISKVYDLNITEMDEKEQKLYIFIFAMIENIKENYANVKDLLKNQTFLYSVLLREQIDSQDLKYKPSKAFENIIINSQDPSVILYAAIIYNKIGDSKQNDFIERGLKTSIPCFFVVLKIQNYLNSLPIEIAEKKVYKLILEYKNDENILIPLKTCITYFLSLNLIEFAKKYIDILEKILPTSIFVLIYKGMFAEKINDDQAQNFYTVALSKEPDGYETNLRLGCFLMSKSDKSFINYIRKAYDNSSTFREAYFSYNIILSYEVFKNLHN